MIYAEDLYLSAMVIFIQCMIMLLNFVLDSMRDELDKATTPPIKNKQCVACTAVRICVAQYKHGGYSWCVFYTGADLRSA